MTEPAVGDRPRKVAVLGAGNWGSTLASLVAANGHRTLLWTRFAQQRDEVNEQHTNQRYVPGLVFAPTLRATTDLREAIEGASLVLFVVPAAAFREVARAAGELLGPEQLVLHATKGLEQGSMRRMSQLLMEETCVRQFGVLAGPNIANEVAAGKPAGTVIASHYPYVIELARRVIGSPRMMIFAGGDPVGVELATAFKNVVAIGAGMATQMEVGENAKALLITRGLAEMTRLGVAMGAEPLTFAGLAGVGDLIVTCASRQSRNNRVGAALARGEKLPEILEKLGQVAEGVYTARVVVTLAREHRIEIPLMERVYRVLYEGLSPAEGLAELMRLPAGHDVSHFRAR